MAMPDPHKVMNWYRLRRRLDEAKQEEQQINALISHVWSSTVLSKKAKEQLLQILRHERCGIMLTIGDLTRYLKQEQDKLYICQKRL